MADISSGWGIGVAVGVTVGVEVGVEVGVRKGVAVDDGTTVGVGGDAGSVPPHDAISKNTKVNVNQ